jgi:hypothetical protein
MDDGTKARIIETLTNILIKLSDAAGRSTLNPKITDYINMAISALNELLSFLSGGGII